MNYSSHTNYNPSVTIDAIYLTIIPETKAAKPAVTSSSQLLMLTQAAQFLNLNPRTLSRWAMCGTVRAFRTGKCLRFELKDILAQAEEVKP